MAEEVPIYEISLDQVSDMMNQLTANMDEQRRFRADMQSYFQQNAKIDRARNDQLAKTGKLWRGIKSEITTSYNLMLKMSKMGIGIGAAGLGLGVAGMYGFNRMSADVGNERRQAQGFGGGTTIGQMKAFDVNLKKVLADPLSVLSSFQKIRETPSESWKERTLLQRAGIGSEEASGSTSADLLVKTLPIQKKIIDDLYFLYKQRGQEVPLNQPGFLASQGLGMYEGNADALRVLHALNEREIPEAVANYTANKGSMNVVDAQAEELQRFNRQWEESVTEISTSFKRTLAPLAPELGALTKEIASTIKSVVDSGDAHKAVTATLEMVDKSVKYLASQDAQKDFQGFWTNIKELGQTIYNINHPLETAGSALKNPVSDWVAGAAYNAHEYMGKRLNYDPTESALSAVAQSLTGNSASYFDNTGGVGRYGVNIKDVLSKNAGLKNEFDSLGVNDFNNLSDNQVIALNKFIRDHEKEINATGRGKITDMLSSGGFNDNKSADKLRQIFSGYGFGIANKIGSLYEKSKPETAFEKRIGGMIDEYNDDYKKAKEHAKLYGEFAAEYNKTPGVMADFALDLSNKAYQSTKGIQPYAMGMFSEKGKLLDKAFNFSENMRFLKGGFNDAKKGYGGLNINPDWSGFGGYNGIDYLDQSLGISNQYQTIKDAVDKVINDEKARKMGDFIRDGKDNKPLSYNFSAKDVKRIEVGVKVESRPGGDVFGQAVALS